MSERITRSNLKVSKDLDELVIEILNGLDMEPQEFWNSLEEILNEFGPKNEALLQERTNLQNKLNKWIDDGLHATMYWIPKRLEERGNVFKYFPEVKSKSQLKAPPEK